MIEKEKKTLYREKDGKYKLLPVRECGLGFDILSHI